MILSTTKLIIDKFHEDIEEAKKLPEEERVNAIAELQRKATEAIREIVCNCDNK
jgi:hypothetical protein